MENNNKQSHYCSHCGRSYSKKYFWGWFFIILGIYFLAREMGIIAGNFWPVLLILLGFYFLRKNRHHKIKKEEEKKAEDSNKDNSSPDSEEKNKAAESELRQEREDKPEGHHIA